MFSQDISHKKRARLLAILWTLLIFFLCFLPAREIPDMDIPLADKWTHFILFGVFAFLWLASIMEPGVKHYVFILIASILLGWGVEYLQGHLTMLGRSQDNMDTLADSVGGLIGIVIYYMGYRWHNRTIDER